MSVYFTKYKTDKEVPFIVIGIKVSDTGIVAAISEEEFLKIVDQLKGTEAKLYHPFLSPLENPYTEEK